MDLEQLVVDIATALYPNVGSETVRTRVADLPRRVGLLRSERDNLLQDYMETHAELVLALRADFDSMSQAVKLVRAERDRLRLAVEDAIGVLGAEEMEYDEWTRVLGRLRAACDGTGDV